MSELVLKSMFAPGKITAIFTSHGKLGVSIQTAYPDERPVGLTISYTDVCHLHDFLTQHLGEQAPKPPVDGQWIYLETDSRGGHNWEQFPTCDRARQFASKRTGFGLKYQAVACLHQQLVPVVTTTYEWKDL